MFAFSGNAIAATDSSDLSTKPLLLDDAESISSNFVNIPINNLSQAEKIMDSIGVQEETSKYVEKIIKNNGMLGNQRVTEVLINKPIQNNLLAASAKVAGYGGYNYTEDTVTLKTAWCDPAKFVSKTGKNNFINEKIERTAIFILGTVADTYTYGSISILQWFGNVFGPNAYPSFTYNAYVKIKETKTVKFTYCEKIPGAGYLLGCQTETSTFYAEPQVSTPTGTKVGNITASSISSPAYNNTTKRQQLAVSYYGSAPHYIERVTTFKYETCSYGSVRY